ncbi:MAG: hypothetical protein V4731_05005 [Pseudomonadota bacterium]
MSRLRFLDQPSRRADYLVLGICMLGILTVTYVRELVYFRDYAIIYEGALRLALGQLPYRDFGSPVGPGSFVMPALLFKLFGVNWSVFLAAQQLQHACLLWLLNALLKRIGTRPFVRWSSLVFVSGLHLMMVPHPWYNTTAFLLLVAAVFCALGSRLRSVVGAGLLSTLTVLTKQDFGLLAVLMAGGFVALMALGSDREKIVPSLDVFTDKSRLMTLGFRLVVFAGAAAGMLVVFIYATDAAKFAYWFNYGQAPHGRRGLSVASFSVLGFATAVVALVRNDFRLLIAAAFIIASSVTKTTSGIYWTHYYFVAFLPLLIDEAMRIKPPLKVLLLPAILYFAFQPARDSAYTLRQAAYSVRMKLFPEAMKSPAVLTSFPTGLIAFSPRTQVPSETLEVILELKRTASEIRALKGQKAELKVINVTELTPIYAELGVAPPLGLPLWFHTGISLFPQEIEQLSNTFSGSDYDIVLVQATHEGLMPTYQRFLSVLRANESYMLWREIRGSPANASMYCEPNCPANIFIYLKKNAVPASISRN